MLELADLPDVFHSDHCNPTMKKQHVSQLQHFAAVRLLKVLVSPAPRIGRLSRTRARSSTIAKSCSCNVQAFF
jgi:hypothetical protein